MLFNISFYIVSVWFNISFYIVSVWFLHADLIILVVENGEKEQNKERFHHFGSNIYLYNIVSSAFFCHCTLLFKFVFLGER